MRNSSRIYSKIRSLYLLAFLLAIAAGVPGLRAEEEGTARLLVERLPEHAESRYHHSDMAPSGDKVAFSVSTGGWNASTIWVYDIPSREMRQLTYPDTIMVLGDVLAQWSPNGETIAFASDRGGKNSLYLVSSDGGEVRRLTPQPLRDDGTPWACRFSWSPDGERIAFSDGDEEGADLFAIRLNDGAIEQFTDHAGIEQHPDWSGDGASIVYVGDQHGTDELWIYELATRTERKVPTGMTLMSYPVWSPDGEWIAFQKLGLTGFVSYLVSTQGGAARKIGPEGYVNWGAAWDPDGSHLLYHAMERIDAPLMVRDLESDHEVQLLKNMGPLGPFWASWSPDGHKLAFNQITESASGALDTALYVASLETASVRRLAKTVVEGSFLKRQVAAWAIDQQSVIAVVPQGRYTQLAAIDLQRGEQRALTSTPTLKSEVAVSPDGELLAYIARADNNEDIWIYDFITEEELQLTFSGDEKFELAFSPSGDRIAYVAMKSIFSVPTDGGEIVRHSRNTGWDILPQWIDPNSLYYSAGTRDRSVIQVIIDPPEERLLYGSEGVGLHLPFLDADRQHLYYLDQWPVGAIKKVGLAEGEETVTIDGPVARPQFSPDGSMVAYIRQEAELYTTIWRQNVKWLTEKAELP